jgi:hypothetical protein
MGKGKRNRIGRPGTRPSVPLSYGVAMGSGRRAAEPDVYAPCPCGSGKKYKWCCRPGDIVRSKW